MHGWCLVLTKMYKFSSICFIEQEYKQMHHQYHTVDNKKMCYGIYLQNRIYFLAKILVDHCTLFEQSLASISFANLKEEDTKTGIIINIQT